jgi:hypothetical protein
MAQQDLTGANPAVELAPQRRALLRLALAGRHRLVVAHVVLLERHARVVAVLQIRPFAQLGLAAHLPGEGVILGVAVQVACESKGSN